MIQSTAPSAPDRVLRVWFEGGGARVVFRLSGTGTEGGATLRAYLEQYVAPEGDHDLNPQVALQPVVAAMLAMTQLENRLGGRTAPNVIT